MLAAAILLASARAEATYSITGADTATAEVGGAGTSCVGRSSVSVIYGSAPGIGVVHAQAAFNAAARDRAVELLLAGRTPDAIIAEITSPAFDSSASQRQYGVTTAAGLTAAFTGADCGAWAGHTSGGVGSLVYTAQGNILTGEAVVTAAARAFESGGCDLADRLMLALEAGAADGGGDMRCTPNGIPSDGAFIRVDRPGAPEWLSLRVDDIAPMNPLVLLRADYDRWRAAHPCEAPADAGVLAQDATIPPEDASTADATAPADESPDACSCHSAAGASSSPGWWWIVLLALRPRHFATRSRRRLDRTRQRQRSRP